jgi:hypothetical protein
LLRPGFKKAASRATLVQIMSPEVVDGFRYARAVIETKGVLSWRQSNRYIHPRKSRCCQFESTTERCR